MAEKYIDLADQIAEDMSWGTAITRDVCRWLDAHPDQVPGRAITHSRVGKAMSGRSGDYKSGILAGLALAEIEQVPDSEPTNAEKLEMALTDYALQHGGMRGGVDEIAAHLDAAGVKAPGDDDD